MRLSRLSAKNFRLLENFTITFSPSITVLIGANNAGKSNIIDALLLFKNGFTNNMQETFNRHGGFERFVSRHDLTRQVELIVELEANGQPLYEHVSLFHRGLMRERLQVESVDHVSTWQGNNYVVTRANQHISTLGIEPPRLAGRSGMGGVT